MMAIVSTTLEYWAVLLWFIRGKPLSECPYLLGDENRQARVQLRALSLVIDEHYALGCLRLITKNGLVCI